MVQLAFLLLGTRAIRGQWRMLASIGAVWTLLGLAIAIDPLDGVQDITMHTLGILLVVEGVVVLLAGLLSGAAGRLWMLRAVALIVPGLLIAETPWRNVVLISVLFGVALLADGAIRLAATLLVRFPGWRFGVAAAAVEFLLAALAFTPWPVSYQATVPFCCGIALMLSGWTVLRSALLLRRLASDAPITSLPIFGQQRGWHIPPVLPGPVLPDPVLPDSGPLASGGDNSASHMIVHVWTPVGGAAGETVRRPVLDRYVAAMDADGTVSTGHASLEMPPDLYISHYRQTDNERDMTEFRQALLGTPRNNVAGRFLPSYAAEVADWWEATEHVVFTRFDPERLRAFWSAYRTDSTYNLTNRNCSVVVAMALDAALEGALGRDRIWPRLVSLVVHPDLHIATLLRKRAASMTWTPGLVLDYARSLQRVVEPSTLSWAVMARQTWRAAKGIRKAHPRAASAVKRPA